MMLLDYKVLTDGYRLQLLPCRKSEDIFGPFPHMFNTTFTVFLAVQRTLGNHTFHSLAERVSNQRRGLVDNRERWLPVGFHQMAKGKAQDIVVTKCRYNHLRTLNEGLESKFKVAITSRALREVSPGSISRSSM